MDWIEEKSEQLKIWIRNRSFRKALIAYVVIAAIVAGILSWITMVLCSRWIPILQDHYDAANTRTSFLLLGLVLLLHTWCPAIYSLVGTIIAILLFYRKRLDKPFQILHRGTTAISQDNLAFEMKYDSSDELGELCNSFEMMRQELVKDKQAMWQLIESQKNLNAAFAHDLRTPLTVLKGYSDFLYRYLPEGQISQDKTLETLKLMSTYLERLEHYSRTMKGIRSIEEMPVQKSIMTLLDLQKELREIIFPLNQIGDIHITLAAADGDPQLYADKNIIIEVFENLLSNSIRFAVQEIKISLAFDSDTDVLLLTVHDDGPGFSNDELEKAVLPYYREHGEDNEEHFGIGLHICSLFCQKHGGDFNIANSMAQGAIVTASFACKYEEF